MSRVASVNMPSYQTRYSEGVPRWNTLLVLLPVLVFQACNRPATARFPLAGQALAVRRDASEIVIKHGDVPGLMPAMVMPFKVRDPADLGRVNAGDFVTATLIVSGSESWLEQLAPTGRHAPVPEGIALPHIVERPLTPGDVVPAVSLVDQDGARFSPADLAGKVWAITFIYTRCPLPTFCPAIDRRFVAAQRLLAADPALADARLVSVTMDPDYDRPAILRAHAERLGADPGRWRFVTGDKDTVDRFGERFGRMVVRGNGTPEEFVHSLRTAVIDRQGRLVRRFGGRTWEGPGLVGERTAAACRRPARGLRLRRDQRSLPPSARSSIAFERRCKYSTISIGCRTTPNAAVKRCGRSAGSWRTAPPIVSKLRCLRPRS